MFRTYCGAPQAVRTKKQGRRQRDAWHLQCGQKGEHNERKSRLCHTYRATNLTGAEPHVNPELLSNPVYGELVLRRPSLPRKARCDVGAVGERHSLGDLGEGRQGDPKPSLTPPVQPIFRHL